jgi:AP-1 complex subunit gamma-1
MEYLLNALVKLTTRFQQSSQISRIKNILAQNTGNLNVEIQQRAVEYQNLFDFDDIRRGVVERMPPPELREENRVLGETVPKKGKPRKLKVRPSAQKDLLDILGGEEKSPVEPSVFGDKVKNAELLKDLFGPSGTNGAEPQQTKSHVADIMDLFGTTTPPPAISTSTTPSNLDSLFGTRTIEPSPHPQTIGPPPLLAHPLTLASVVAYAKNDLTISFQPTNSGAGKLSIQAVFRNDSIASTFSKVNMQVAVPKSQKLRLEPISSSTIPVGGESTQNLRITATQGVCCCQGRGR